PARRANQGVRDFGGTARSRRDGRRVPGGAGVHSRIERARTAAAVALTSVLLTLRVPFAVPQPSLCHELVAQRNASETTKTPAFLLLIDSLCHEATGSRPPVLHAL